jgi:hypothetical protein
MDFLAFSKIKPIIQYSLFLCYFHSSQATLNQVREGVGLDSITREPTILWHQRKRTVGISVQIKDVGKYKMELTGDRTLEFSTWNSGFLFRFK